LEKNQNIIPRADKQLRGYALLGKEVFMSCGSCGKKPKKKAKKKKK
jgi:hypothetical protein